MGFGRERPDGRREAQALKPSMKTKVAPATANMAESSKSALRVTRHGEELRRRACRVVPVMPRREDEAEEQGLSDEHPPKAPESPQSEDPSALSHLHPSVIHDVAHRNKRQEEDDEGRDADEGEEEREGGREEDGQDADGRGVGQVERPRLCGPEPFTGSGTLSQCAEHPVTAEGLEELKPGRDQGEVQEAARPKVLAETRTNGVQLTVLTR